MSGSILMAKTPSRARFDELGVGRGDAGDVLDGRHVRALDQVPELAQEREGLLQDEVVARVIGRLVHEVQGLPAKVLLDLGEGLRLQEIAAIGVRGDVGIPVGDLFGRGKAGSEFTQGCGIQSLRYERRRHADMQPQVYRSAPCCPPGAGAGYAGGSCRLSNNPAGNSRPGAPAATPAGSARRGAQVLALLRCSSRASALVAGLGGLATATNVNGWYATADKAPWSPPNWVFGPVWTLLYTAMAVAAWLVWRRRAAGTRPALTAYGVQLVLNLLWTPVFFGLYPVLGTPALWIAFGIIVALAVAVAVTVLLLRTDQPDRGAADAALPAWVVFASSLNLWAALTTTDALSTPPR